MRIDRTAPVTPATSGVYPVAAAIAFIALVVGSLWWQTRAERDEPALAAVAEAPALTQPKAAEAKPEPVLAPVAAFAAFAGQEPPADLPGTRAYTARGMRLLADAIAASGDSLLWRDRAKRLVEAADQVENSSEPTRAAAVAHEAIGLAAEWVGDLRVAGPAADAPDPLASAAQAIAADELLRNQADRIERFFDAAAEALEGSSAST